ncbi:MAG: prenyltransferase [Deltaproteobacteria bacterium]|nr:prenyltransferase [Deltaproteobacteria bacterium]
MRAAVLGPMRLPFVALTPTCVLLGAAAAALAGAAIEPLQFAIALVGAIAAHISVNALNEYSDFRTGVDLQTQRTPFSGGSGALPRHPAKAHYALITGVVGALTVVAVGLYFIRARGVSMLPIGLVGLAAVVGYTPWLTRRWLLCLIAPGVGFGLAMVMGTGVALGAGYTWPALVAALVPTFLVSDLLLLNQFPDVDADRAAGRRNVPIVFGRRAGAVVYALFLAGAYLAVIAGWACGLFPALALLGLTTLPLAVTNALGALRHAERSELLVPLLGRNVLINLATPALLALGLWLGR